MMRRHRRLLCATLFAILFRKFPITVVFEKSAKDERTQTNATTVMTTIKHNAIATTTNNATSPPPIDIESITACEHQRF
jgi:hypothetical protein